MIAHARNTDPDTSHAAAASVGDLRLSQSCVLQVLRTYGEMTDERLVATYEVVWQTFKYPQQSASGLRSRRAELVQLGLVEYAEKKQMISTGRYARVWRVK